MENKQYRPAYAAFISTLFLLVLLGGCLPELATVKTESSVVPESFAVSKDTVTAGAMKWRDYFADTNLIALIDTALKNNQELNIIQQEMEIRKYEIGARRGEYLPFVGLRAGAGLDREGRYTRNGAVDDAVDIEPGKRIPSPLADYTIGAYASWEVDVWGKLHNAEKSALSRYLASTEGKNLLVTQLIAEIAESYYELMALDNVLLIVQKNTELQTSALNVMKVQKEAARVTQLAVNRFEAQLLNTQNLQYAVRQRITETENRINVLTARFPQPVRRSSAMFSELSIDSLRTGIPSQLLRNRPDIRQAELELAATKLDVESARANFYPSFGMKAGVGFRAFNPSFLVNPESMLFGIAGDILAPLINRNAIEATYASANARQIQAAYQYEQTILRSYADVLNQLAALENSAQSHATKLKEVETLNQSVNIANNLFASARADYGEVLLTQREALDARMDLIDVKLKQMHAKVNIYRALGGGWR
ncbi:MAG: TolC family protein [Candidatus Kapabacteria bacterium]|nr:TolC family protein [Candidatus Kapabacteria bacterium]